MKNRPLGIYKVKIKQGEDGFTKFLLVLLSFYGKTHSIKKQEEVIISNGISSKT